MDAFRRIFLVAGLAGLITGVLLSLVHALGTVPIILEAETYEQAGAAVTAPAAHDHGPGVLAGHDHAEDEAAWAPQDGVQRTSFTVLADVLTAIGFGLLLVGAWTLSGRDVGPREGLGWGLAGFAAFNLAPTLGMPPELPGTEAAPLLARQAWWLATVAATGGGLALVLLARGGGWAAAGIALLVLPHLYGAPQPAEHHGAAPEALAREFVAVVLATNLLFWAALGTLSGYLLRRTRGGVNPIEGRGALTGSAAG